MSKLSQEIFHGAVHKMSSPFGKRDIIKTAAGNTSSFHSGTDYSTYSVKLPQYAVDNGSVDSCGKDYTGANYVWISYPSLNVRMLHYHLDSVCVKAKQKVDKNTLIGYTGKTGKATGIHLHLGIKRIGSNDYIDPEKWCIEEFEAKYKTGNYKVTKADLLNVRKGAGTNFAKLKFSELTKDAQKKILKLSGKQRDGYVKGLTFSALEIKGCWGRTPSGWVCLDYCEAI